MLHEAGHTFLARLGKKRLRPGGIKATSWLLGQTSFTKDTRVLEVACNMGTTAIELARRYGCHITGVDMDGKALKKARTSIRRARLGHLVTVQQANALKLPFADESFDVVINEAMLTMLKKDDKPVALAEYLRVLRPGGILLTHDVCVSPENMEKTIHGLIRAINTHAEPKTQAGWEELFHAAGFSEVTVSSGPMTLMSPVGMIRDEGFFGALKIIANGLKKQNRTQFRRMFTFMRSNRKNLGFVAAASLK